MRALMPSVVRPLLRPGIRQTIRPAINDGLRSVIGMALRMAGGLLQLRHRWRIVRFRSSQARLRRRYRIRTDTPITDRIGVPAGAGSGAKRRRSSPRVARTSGSTGQPKEVPYPSTRLRGVRLAFIDVFLRCFWKLEVSRTSFYVFGSPTGDESLTALLLEEPRLPSCLVTLQAPYRAQADPALRSLGKRYGIHALRLWILCLSNPGVLYSTNPSTLSTFFDELRRDWPGSSALVRDYVRAPDTLPAAALRTARRLLSRGCQERLERIADSRSFVPIGDWAPGVDTYICWTGGYVAPFLDRVRTCLPSPRYRLVPMYSMSTETIETVTHFDRDGVAFLPMAPGVFYEFLEEGLPQEGQNLRPGARLEKGGAYSMLVSHPYGARRYQTGDVFLVAQVLGELPDLRFLRRQGLSYSFTGEKLTGEQLAEAYLKLRADRSTMDDSSLLTCFPSHPDSDPIPHYKLALIHRDGSNARAPAGIAERCDRLLGELNIEYRYKRESGRLGPVRLHEMQWREFRRRMSGSTLPDFEPQFKFLPLYPFLWESIGRP